MLLDFRTLFLSSTNITGSAYRGWAGGMGVGKEPKEGSSEHWNRKAAIMCSWKYKEGHSVLIRPRQSLATVSHQV